MIVYIHTYTYIYIYICICMYIYIRIQQNNLISRLSPQRSCGSTCIWVWRNRASCVQVHEMPQIHRNDNWEGTLFLWMHIYITRHLGFARFEHSVYCGSYMCIYIYIYIYILYIYYGWLHFSSLKWPMDRVYNIL